MQGCEKSTCVLSFDITINNYHPQCLRSIIISLFMYVYQLFKSVPSHSLCDIMLLSGRADIVAPAIATRLDLAGVYVSTLQ